jgi:hypothetical protein
LTPIFSETIKTLIASPFTFMIRLRSSRVTDDKVWTLLKKKKVLILEKAPISLKTSNFEKTLNFEISLLKKAHSAIAMSPTAFSGWFRSLCWTSARTASCSQQKRLGERSPFRIHSDVSTLNKELWMQRDLWKLEGNEFSSVLNFNFEGIRYTCIFTENVHPTIHDNLIFLQFQWVFSVFFCVKLPV